MRALWRNTIPFAVGLALPWQTVLIFSKPNEFAVVQLFGWQIVILAWWWRQGRPEAWGMAAALGAFSVPALFLADPGSAVWHATALAVGVMVYGVVRGLPAGERIWLHRGLAVGFMPVLMLAFWQVTVGGSPASTALGLAERSAQRLGEGVVMVDGERVLRAYSTFAHPNIFAAWSVLMVALGLRARERWGKWLMVAGIVGVLVSASRAGVLALGLVALWYAVERRNRGALLWPTAVIMVVVLWVAIAFMPKMLMSVRGGGALEERSITERQAQTAQAVALLSSPRTALLGTGVGQSTLVQEKQNPGQPTYVYQPVHNTALLILIELGIPLTLLLAALAWQERARIPVALAVLAPFFAVDHFLWTSAVGPLILGLLSTLDERLLSGKITKQ